VKNDDRRLFRIEAANIHKRRVGSVEYGGIIHLAVEINEGHCWRRDCHLVAIVMSVAVKINTACSNYIPAIQNVCKMKISILGVPWNSNFFFFLF